MRNSSLANTWYHGGHPALPTFYIYPITGIAAAHFVPYIYGCKRRKMQKIILLLLLATGLTSRAQFAGAVKDSVLAWMELPGAKYSINLGFRAEDYSDRQSDVDSLAGLEAAQLLAKRTGHYTDAALLRLVLTKQLAGGGDTTGTTALLLTAGQLYEQWVNAEPDNTRPLEELVQLCTVSGSHTMVPGVLDYGLNRFPKHLPLLQQAIHFYLNVRHDYDRAQVLIDKALAMNADNLATLQQLVTLESYGQMAALRQGQPLPPLQNMPALAAALQRQPNNTGLRHLDWFRRVFHIYFSGVGQFMQKGNDDALRIFDYFSFDQQQVGELRAAEAWMLQAAAKKGANEAQLYSSLAVMACMVRDYGKAVALFEKAIQLANRESDREAVIMACFFNADFEGVEKRILQRIAAQPSPLDYAALLRVYQKYLKRPQAILPLLQELETKLPEHNPLRNQVLALGYLQLRQTDALPRLLPLLGTSAEDWTIKLMAAILTDQRNEAAACLDKVLQIDPADEKALKIKKMAGL
jgi:tetratricopeptide (TPR) repeat protein